MREQGVEMDQFYAGSNMSQGRGGWRHLDWVLKACCWPWDQVSKGVMPDDAMMEHHHHYHCICTDIDNTLEACDAAPLMHSK